MIEQSVPKRTTRWVRVDYPFTELLHEDFGIPMFSLQAAFVGVPSVPKKEAIQVCEWAVRITTNPDDAGDALRSWAKKNGRGSYHPNVIGAPLNTFEGV